MQEDWVFASPTMKGEQPYWPDNLMKRYIKPVTRANGIYKNIGWHTFRHTFGTLLKAKRGRCEDGTGAFTAREQQDHTGCLHAGGGFQQARRAKQGCKDDDSRHWVKTRVRWTRRKLRLELNGPLSDPDLLVT
jgi:hypothetical protein